jgi:AcrR family transcriptional regulator
VSEILDAAEELLLEGGPESMTIRAVAERVDMAVGALYRYFPSKESMLAGVGGRMLVTLASDLKESVKEIDKVRSDDGPEVASLFALQWVSLRYYQRCLESYELYQLANMMLVEQRKLLNPEERLGFMGEVFEFLGQVAELVSQAGEAKALQVDEPMEQALLLWSSQNGVLQLKKLGREDTEIVKPHQLQRQLVHTLLKGWGAKDSTLAQAWKHVEAQG